MWTGILGNGARSRALIGLVAALRSTGPTLGTPFPLEEAVEVVPGHGPVLAALLEEKTGEGRLH